MSSIKFTSQGVKEILVEYYSLKLHDILKESSTTAQHAVEHAFEFNPEKVPLARDSGRIFISNFEDFSSTATFAAAMHGHPERLDAFTRGLLNPVLNAGVVKLLDAELQILWPAFASRGLSFTDKARALARARNKALNPSMEFLQEAAVQASKEKSAMVLQKLLSETAPKAANQIDEPEIPSIRPFTVIVSNFTTDRRAKFLNGVDFVFYLVDSIDPFQQFLKAIRCRTLARSATIPPPAPYPDFLPSPPRNVASASTDGGEVTAEESRRARNDSISSVDTQSTWDEPTERPSLKYSKDVVSRAEGERGYTLKDGHWIYRIGVKGGHEFGPQHVFASRDDFIKMIMALNTARKINPGIEPAVKMIHSQDRIGHKRWVRQARKNEEARVLRDQEEAKYFDQDAYDRAIDEHYGDPKPGEAIEGLVTDMLRM